MTYQSQTFVEANLKRLSDSEWVEMIAIKQAISENPASVHPDKMEYFTELLVRSHSWVGMDIQKTNH